MSKSLRHLVSTTAELRREKCDRTAFAAKPRLPIRVVLDRVTQAYNIGAMFRLCDAMLAERLVITGVEVDLSKRNLGQAACGTQHWTPWSQEKSALDAVLRAKADGYQIAVVELASSSIRPEAFAPEFPVCLVLGGEFDGVSRTLSILPTLSSKSRCAGWPIPSTSPRRRRLSSMNCRAGPRPLAHELYRVSAFDHQHFTRDRPVKGHFNALPRVRSRLIAATSYRCLSLRASGSLCPCHRSACADLPHEIMPFALRYFIMPSVARNDGQPASARKASCAFTMASVSRSQ